MYSHIISRDMKKRRSSEDSQDEESTPKTEGETNKVADELVDVVAETIIDPAQAENARGINRKEITERNEEGPSVDSDVNEIMASEINGVGDTDKPDDNYCVDEITTIGTEEGQPEHVASINVDKSLIDGTGIADEVESAKPGEDDGDVANTSADNVNKHDQLITEIMNGGDAVNVPLMDGSVNGDDADDIKDDVENTDASFGQHGTTDAVNDQSKDTLDDTAAASKKGEAEQDSTSSTDEIQEEVVVGINASAPLNDYANDISVQSMVGDGDASLSIHEKLIQKECDDWIANKVEPEQPENTTPRAIEINTSYEADDNESFSDESFKRKASIEMEDVDLVEDKAFSGRGAKEAFTFLVGALRDKLGDEAKNVPDATLKQYLCWKPDVKRAMERYRAHEKYLKANFNQKTLLLSVNPNVCYLLRNEMALAPEELVDKNGSAVMVIRAKKCDLSSTHNCSDSDACQAIFFTVQQMLERKYLDTLIGGIVIVLDLTGCARKNISGKLIKMLGNATGCFPIRIRAIYVVAMPWWFPYSNKRLLSAKLRERIHLLKDKAALSEYIDEDRLLEEDGGIYNFDLQSWISTTLAAEVGMKAVP